MQYQSTTNHNPNYKHNYKYIVVARKTFKNRISAIKLPSN